MWIHLGLTCLKTLFSHLLCCNSSPTKKKEITFNHPIAYPSYFLKTQSILKASDKTTLNNAISKKVNVFKDWLTKFFCRLRWFLEVKEFQLSYFKFQKMMLWKRCTLYASKCGKLNSGHRTGQGQFSLQSQRKAMPKNVQTITQLHSSHMLAK